MKQILLSQRYIKVLSIEQKISKLMDEKSMSKVPQYLAANDLKDVYF